VRNGAKYLILSKKWSRHRSQFLVWYRPGSHGYTEDLLEAGRFTKEEAESIVRGAPEVVAMVHDFDAYKLAVMQVLVPASELHIQQLAREPSTTYGRLAPVCFSKGIQP
jgi:hypothetical protein